MSRSAVNRLVDACDSNDIDTVCRLIERGVDINHRKSGGGLWDGCTGLMVAMRHNRVAIVRMLLASESVDLAALAKGGYFQGMTALHFGCRRGAVEAVRLFLAHPKCTQEIVGIVNKGGFTAEMVATVWDSQECGRLVREYLDANVVTTGAASTSPPQESPPSIGQLAEALAKVEREEAERKCRKEELAEAMAKKEKEEVELKGMKEALAESLAKEEREEAELKRRKEALTATLMERARPSLVPECPVCLVKMAPPRQIFNCSNGHLICNLCKLHIAGNLCVTRCQGSYTGRATAVEQIVRYTLGIE